MNDKTTKTGQEPRKRLWDMRKKAVNSVGGAIGHAEFPAGDLAALRNLKLDSPLPPAYWRLVTDPARVPGELSRGEENESRWAVLMQAMAIMAPECHQPGASLGKVLAGMDRGTMEARLMKLLASRGRVTWYQIRLFARMLANQGQQIDFNDLAALLFIPEGPVREQARRRIARDFFIAQYKKDKKAENAKQ